MTLGEIVKALRKERKLTQEEFAKQTKISRSAIGMYESGKREPNFETLEAFADFFNVDMNTLLGTTPAPAASAPQPSAVPRKAPLTKREQDHINLYRELDDEGRAVVDSVTRTYADKARDEGEDFASSTGERNKYA